MFHNTNSTAIDLDMAKKKALEYFTNTYNFTSEDHYEITFFNDFVFIRWYQKPELKKLPLGMKWALFNHQLECYERCKDVWSADFDFLLMGFETRYDFIYHLYQTGYVSFKEIGVLFNVSSERVNQLFKIGKDAADKRAKDQRKLKTFHAETEKMIYLLSGIAN